MFLITRIQWLNTSGLPKCFPWSGPLTYGIESESGGLMSGMCMGGGSASSILSIPLPYEVLLGAAFIWCKTHFTMTFLMWKVRVKILKTKVVDMFVWSAVFLLVHLFSLSRLVDDNHWPPLFYLLLSVDLCLDHQLCFLWPSWKRNTHHDFAVIHCISSTNFMYSTWISCGFFPYKVSVLMYGCWPLSDNEPENFCPPLYGILSQDRNSGDRKWLHTIVKQRLAYKWHRV